MARRPESRGDGRLRLSAPGRWLLHHRMACRTTVDRLTRNRLDTVLVLLTIGIALALPGLLWVTVERLDDLTARWDGTPRINVFMVGEDAATTAEGFTALGDVAAVRFQSPEESLEELVAATGMGDLFDGAPAGFDAHPLPAVAVVTPVAEAASPARIRALAAELEGTRGVEAVQVDLEWVQRLQAALALLERLTWGLGTLLGAAVLLVVASLTRMAVEQRRDEVRVLKLVGGSDGFVLRPFLYLGLLLGLGGGLVAVLLLALALAFFGVPVAELARSYGSDFRLGGLPPESGLAVLAAGAFLGWTGAAFTARRELRGIEP